MKYINLIDKLSEEDKFQINNYIYTYGINEEDFCGLESWLEDWSHANQKLYKLLGNQFIYKVPFTFEKKEDDLRREIKSLLGHPFRWQWDTFTTSYLKDKLSYSDYQFFKHLLTEDNFIKDSTIRTIKIHLEGKKTLQLQAGMKPLRAIQKTMEYFSEYDKWDWKTFDRFRIKHSMILNDKTVHGNLCFSIHPLDYMTMSDNNCNWTSCMNWMESGCYCVGTIEMMNSNNILCCYIEGTDKFYFISNSNKDAYWNNKRWRILTCVTKDIIVTGKSYPFVNNDFSIEVLKNVRKLAEENLHWTYSFGPELYQDMKYVHSEYPLMRSRDYIMANKTTKHNILFDTKGMYNDMLNDHERKYWCVRNKVKQNKVISLSGKCTCLSCKESIISKSRDTYDYNERFYNYGSLVCEECLDKHRCDLCTASKRIERNYIIQTEQSKLQICKYCFRKQVKYCPCCGEPMLIDPGLRGPIVVPKKFFAPEKQRIRYEKWTYFGENYYNVEDTEPANPIFMCQNCLKDKYKKYLSVEKYVDFYNDPVYAPVFKGFNPGEQFYYPNLKSVSIEEVENKIIRTCADFKIASQIARN